MDNQNNKQESEEIKNEQIQQQEQQEQQEQQNEEEPDVIFAQLKGSDEPIIIESLCMNCHKKGNTTLLLTKIPMFQEIIISSFYCEECGFKNNDVQFGGKIQEFGIKFVLKCMNMDDFQRDVIKSEFATIKISEIGLEIPRNKKGQVNTIEGFLLNTIEDLQSDQELRRQQNPELAIQISQFIIKVRSLMEGEILPFTFEIDDPTGNSFIKNPYFPEFDKYATIQRYTRSEQQLLDLDYVPENKVSEEEEQKNTNQNNNQEQDLQEQQKIKSKMIDGHVVPIFPFNFNQENILNSEAQIFPTNCHSCYKEGETKMCSISIPYFKELIIMSFKCSFCGAKSAEVKAGGEISEKGRLLTLNVQTKEDLNRDMFKSDNAKITLPEIGFSTNYGTLGGVYTTVEGLMTQLKENLEEINPFGKGDSSTSGYRSKMDDLLNQLDDRINLKYPYVIIIEDLLDNSFIQNPYYPEHDPRVKSELFERTEEQNEELGLNDMNVDNYQNQSNETQQQKQQEQNQEQQQ